MCPHLGQTQLHLCNLSVRKRRRFISLPIHLSILRGQRCHVDSGTNPEKMPNLAVNKERAWTSSGHSRLSVPPLRRAHAGSARRLCGKEARPASRRHSCPSQSVGHKLLRSKLTSVLGENNPSACWRPGIWSGPRALGHLQGNILFYSYVEIQASRLNLSPCLCLSLPQESKGALCCLGSGDGRCISLQEKLHQGSSVWHSSTLSEHLLIFGGT